MLEENDRNNEIKRKDREKARLEDVNMQKAYAAMLDKQEQDRQNEIAAREQRAQEFMNRMADGVLKDMDQAQRREDQMIQKYQRDREMRLRREEEKKARQAQRNKDKMKATLAKQEEEKRKRQEDDKAHHNEQAVMWKKERDLWQEEDDRIQKKIKDINKETQNFLKQQVAEKQKKQNRMNLREQQMNKALMREIKQKRGQIKEME